MYTELMEINQIPNYPNLLKDQVNKIYKFLFSYDIILNTNIPLQNFLCDCKERMSILRYKINLEFKQEHY